MAMCKAIIQEGVRKGEQCLFPPDQTGYCGRHVRNKGYDDGISEGKKWCRFFFRGCDSIIGVDETGKNDLTCKSCKEKMSKKQNKCSHEGCKFKTNNAFCNKHQRDKYYAEEKEKGITFCNIPRGCFTPVIETKRCKECLENARISDSTRRMKKKQLLVAAQEAKVSTRSCIKCSKDFDAFITQHGKESVKCKSCASTQASQDAKRADRRRNYKAERLRNLQASYKNHNQESLKRGHGDFHLTFDEFSRLVTGYCYYCKHKDDNEAIGIDRINNDIGYTKENCVPACWKCNKMKYFYHPSFFVEKCKILIKETMPTKPFYTKWATYYTRSSYKNYTTYKRESEELRNLDFELTQNHWDWLTRSPCYLCGYQDSYGIGLDRVNNEIRKYTIENCRPCCGSCNAMKADLSLDDLLKQCKRISDTHTSLATFDAIPQSKNPLKQSSVPEEERKHWKAKGLYYSILSDSAEPFLETYKEVFTKEEFDTLCKEIKSYATEAAISHLKDVLAKLRKRRFRLTPS